MRMITMALIFAFFKYCYAAASTPDSVRIEKYLKQADDFIRSTPDSAIFYIEKAKKVANGQLPGRFLSKAKQTLGFYYINKEEFGKATESFLSALAIEEARNDKERIASINVNLGYMYTIYEKFNKSMGYYDKAFTIYTSLKDTAGMANVYTKIGNLHAAREFCENRTDTQKRQDYLTGIAYYKRALGLYTKIKNREGIINVHHNMGVVYNKLGEPHKAIHYLEPLIEYYIEIRDFESVCNIKRALGRSYLILKDYKKSINCYNESIDDAIKYSLTGGIQFVYGEAAYAYEAAGDYKNAKNYYVKYMILRDSIYNSEKTKQIVELETKFQTEKKEKEILALTIMKKKRDFFIYSLILAFVTVVVAGLFFLTRLRSKRIIAEQQNLLKEQKIKELENERQLIATQSVLRGEETERARLARDLHDGLGGLLSGVKLSLTHLKGTYLLPQENIIKFDRTLELLDTSIVEMRRISHNMMPEALVKFGLKDALQDFVNRMDKKQGIQFRFQFFGTERRLDSSLETATYRIAMELVNNAIKHAEANEVMVQLVQDEKRLHLTVQDNGKGFDVKLIDPTKSTGIKNLKARIESFRGELDIDTQPGKGTEITVEFTF